MNPQQIVLAGSVKSALWPCLYFFLTRMYDFLLYMSALWPCLYFFLTRMYDFLLYMQL